MGEFLSAELIAVVVLALTALLARERVSSASGVGMIGLLILVPLVRVGWLAARWWTRGDRRFALVAAAVLVVVSTGFVLSRY
jgi:hypothetical protein